MYAKILQNYSKEFIYLIIYINNKYRQQFTLFSYCYLLLVTNTFSLNELNSVCPLVLMLRPLWRCVDTATVFLLGSSTILIPTVDDPVHILGCL